jgi:hypothetical protein
MDILQQTSLPKLFVPLVSSTWADEKIFHKLDTLTVANPNYIYSVSGQHIRFRQELTVMCPNPPTIYVYCTLTEVFINLTEVSLTLTVVFVCFFLSCKANARVKTRKDRARPALVHIICYLGCSVICVVLCIVCV